MEISAVAGAILMMARREWAEQLYEKAQRLKEPDDQFSRLPDYLVLRLVKAEHARAVRVVKVRDKWLLDGGYDNMSPDFQAGYHQACHHILAALTKGRA